MLDAENVSVGIAERRRCYKSEYQGSLTNERYSGRYLRAEAWCGKLKISLSLQSTVYRKITKTLNDDGKQDQSLFLDFTVLTVVL